MAKAKVLVVGERTFASITEAAQHFGIHPNVLARRLRYNWTPAQAVGADKKPSLVGHGIRVEIDGKAYPHIVAASLAFGQDPKNVRSRVLRGLSIEEALKYQPKKRVGVGKSIEYKGISYLSHSALAQAHNLSGYLFHKRVKAGWTVPQALGEDPPPPRFRNFEGHARNAHWKRARIVNGVTEPEHDGGGYKLYVVKCLLSNKEYVGQTTGSIDDRWRQHCADARRQRKTPLGNAIRKYGPEQFSAVLIRNDAKSWGELQQQEIEEIERRDTLRNGYNVAQGGGLSTSKRIEVNGIEFATRGQAATHFGIDPGVFNLRVARLRWTPEQAAGLEERRWAGKKVEIDVMGKSFPAIRQAAQHFGKDYKLVYGRRKQGWTLEQALDLAAPPGSIRYRGQRVVIQGVEYPSLEAAGTALDFSAEAFRKRVSEGASPDEAYQRSRKRTGPQKSVSVHGETYPTVKHSARAFGKNYSTVFARLSRGWSLEQALELQPAQPNVRAARPIAVRGVVYRSLAEAARKLGIGRQALTERLDRGLSPDEAYDDLVGNTPSGRAA